jgi:hypothetical protein
MAMIYLALIPKGTNMPGVKIQDNIGASKHTHSCMNTRKKIFIGVLSLIMPPFLSRSRPDGLGLVSYIGWNHLRDG